MKERFNLSKLDPVMGVKRKLDWKGLQREWEKAMDAPDPLGRDRIYVSPAQMEKIRRGELFVMKPEVIYEGVDIEFPASKVEELFRNKVLDP